MATKDFFKVMGAQERHDELYKLSANNYVLFVLYGEENGQGYVWRKDYDHKPEEVELRTDINALINSITDSNILSGFVWNGKPVYLSQENQMNFKAACDLAVQTGGAILPVKFKLGEDAEGNPVYHTFTKIEPMQDFIMKAFAYINQCTNAGWVEKDGIDYTKFNI